MGGKEIASLPISYLSGPNFTLEDEGSRNEDVWKMRGKNDLKQLDLFSWGACACGRKEKMRKS